MQLEIERKFLLRRVPTLEYSDCKLIVQCYAWCEDKKDYDRYRESISEDGSAKYFHTFKKRIKSGVQEEYEEEIEKEVFYSYFDRCDKFIKKRRRIYVKKDLIWEIDDFIDLSLVVAEIELPKEGHEFKIPKKIKKEVIMEVTEFPQFYNSNLAIKVK